MILQSICSPVWYGKINSIIFQINELGLVVYMSLFNQTNDYSSRINSRRAEIPP